MLLIFGDICDRSVPPANASKSLDDVVNHILEELNVPVFIVAGNHGNPEQLGNWAQQWGGTGFGINLTVSRIGSIVIGNNVELGVRQTYETTECHRT